MQISGNGVGLYWLFKVIIYVFVKRGFEFHILFVEVIELFEELCKNVAF